MTSENDNNFNNEDENIDPNNPFGFSFDAESLSGMINDLVSGSGMGMIGGIPGMGSNDGPMGIAQRVAADIAARDLENESEEELVAEENQSTAKTDPMAEIMGILSMLSSPPTKTNALQVDAEFADRCSQIYPAAQTYVTNQACADDVSSLPLVVTDRVTWTKDYIDSMEGPLQVASKSLNPTFGENQAPEPDPNQPFGFDIQSLIANSVAPMMFGVQAGTMLGFLSHRSYGDDDILLPTKLPTRVGVIASAVQKFSNDWSVATDEAILYFLILQTLRAHIRKNSWLTKRLDILCTKYVAAYELNPYKLEELMSDMDISSPESMTAVNVTPQQMFDTLRTPAHDVLDEEIGRISSLHDAYVEWVMHKGLEPLLPNYRIIQEARKRITVTTSDADRFVEQLFGVATTRADREEATAFINGVVERDEEQKLHELWNDEDMIPTEAEFAAPGLWLARLEMMEN